MIRPGNNRDLIVDNVKLPVMKRKYPVDIPNLQNVLRAAKKESELSNKDIAELLSLPLTHVQHWFRTDKYFSIPDKDIWFDLKDILGINDDSFDKSIMEFEIVDGKYDMNNRVYSTKGLAPTLKTCNDLIKEERRL